MLPPAVYQQSGKDAGDEGGGQHHFGQDAGQSGEDVIQFLTDVG
ncbi:hypothetical protein [Parapedobacter composti]|nr:hypothetical protein [Parapedobacter composti]